MIEMLGVLAIIGVLSVGGIAGYSKAMMKYRINKTIEQITLIAGNIRAFWGPQGNYEGLENSTKGKVIIKKAKLVPDEMWDDDNLINAFGVPNFSVSAEHKSSDTDKKAFSMAFYGFPAEACIEIVTQDWDSAGIKAITIGERYYNKSLKTPIDLATATNICSEAESKNSALQYGFRTNFYFDIDVNSTYWKDTFVDN